MKKLLFYCQHVLGIGHLIRSLEIARALTDFDVTFLNGGGSFDGLEFPRGLKLVDLPAVNSTFDFSELRSDDSSVTTADLFERRRELILSALEQVKPDVILVELFPFGRLKFANEIVPMLERGAELGAKTVCSLRDILVTKSQQAQFEQQACDIINRYYAAILVHSDPKFHSFSETFPSASAIEVPVLYTGFVAHKQERESMDREDLILVSIGGGRVGGELLLSAAKSLSFLPADMRMKLVTGPYFPVEEMAGLRAYESDRLSVEVFVQDFERQLSKAKVSVSLAGYNTCMNILNTGTPAFLYPFTGRGNQEQTIRARKLEQAGIASLLEPDDLEPSRLARRIEGLLKTPVRAENPFDMDGARKTNDLLMKIVAGGVDG
jgi:predicted glycosyltransferase